MAIFIICRHRVRETQTTDMLLYNNLYTVTLIRYTDCSKLVPPERQRASVRKQLVVGKENLTHGR